MRDRGRARHRLVRARRPIPARAHAGGPRGAAGAKIEAFYGRRVRQRAGAWPTTLFRLVHDVKPGDLVVAADGETNLAIGRVTGDYGFDASAAYAHHRAVEWLDIGEWKFPETEGLRTTLIELKKSSANLLAVERRLRAPRAPVAPPGVSVPPVSMALPALDPTTARVQAVLARKGQVILYGPPGTGKTHHAERAARELAARDWFAQPFERLTESQRREVLGGPTEPGAIETCCFHPAYGYEDFLEGYRPRLSDGALAFQRRDGVFKRLCARAQAQPTRPFYLLIDEINRGDIPRIFGELLMVLEKGRRGDAVVLPVSGERFAVPPNVFVIGTMNTADRSIALLDTALRRRFGFVECMPDSAALGDAVVAGIPLGPWLDALNARILRHVGRDARNLQVGHAYLLHAQRPVGDLGHLAQVLRDDIVPLLEEYCYEDYAALERILGATLVLRDRQRIDDTLFSPARADDLVRALLQPCPEITASPQALAHDNPQETEETDDGEGDA
jgi:5-methylcytosine-specific restriction protein B